MKIYKMDIDASKPIRKVSRMQQNSDGVLSVNISNDGKYIRNLSCSVYADGAEVSAVAEGDNAFGYKFAVGESPKTVKVVAKSTPTICEADYVANMGTGTRTKQVFLNLLQIAPGVYNQDEFASLARFGGNNGFAVIMTPQGDITGKTNFSRIVIVNHNPNQQVWFYDANNGETLASDAELSVLSAVNFGRLATVKYQGYVISSETYPAIGYWTDYSFDHVIMPSTNAACYADVDLAEPQPEEPEVPAGPEQE